MTFQLCAVPLEPVVFEVFPPGQSSAASSEQTVHIPVPYGGQHDFQPPSAADFSNPPDNRFFFFRTFPGKKCEDPTHSEVRECPGGQAHGLHELSWRLYVLHGERHGVRLFLLVAPGRVVWAGALLFRLPSYPVVQKLSPVWTEHGVVFARQSTDASGKFPCLCGLFALSAHGVGYSGSRPRIWQSLSLCLFVACGVQLDFRGDATDLRSTVDTCSASASRGYLAIFTHFL